jgi:acetyl esterase/lipase
MKSSLKNSTISLLILSFIFCLSSFSLLYGQASDYGFIDGKNYQKDVVYKTVDGENLTMDFFYPSPEKRKENMPWMVFVHGGGWAGGNKDNIFKNAYLGTLKNLLDNGVLCVTIDYRRAKAPITSYESVVDCKDAARFLIKNAKQYQLDVNQYGIWGGSAGGHLSLVTALVPDSCFPGDTQLSDIHPQYKCIASFYPFTSCLNPDIRPNSIFGDGTLFNRLLGGTVEEKPELAHLLSPTEFLKEDSPSILLLHGDNDQTLPIINSLYMMEVAKKTNADVELLTVKNGGHCFSGKNISPSFEKLSDSCANYILSHLRTINNNK